jgi:Flp pilus assembly pilin Flp
MRFISDSMLKLYVWFTEEKAQTMAEYGLILALVSVAAIIVLGTVGGKLGDVFGSIANSLSIG